MELGFYIKHSPHNHIIDVVKAKELSSDVVIRRFRYTGIQGDFESQYVQAVKLMRKLNS